MQKLLYPLLAIILLISSCQKDIVFVDGSGPGGAPPTGGNGNQPADGISGTSWRLTGYTANIDYGGGLVFDMDLFSAYPACSQDDIHTFNTDGTITDDAGTTKCSPTDPQTVQSGNWKLSTDKKILTFSTTIPNAVGLTSLDGEIVELTATKYVMRYYTYYNGPKTTNLVTYIRVK